MSPSAPHSATARTGGTLSGSARVPGDKSISHRVLILGAMAVGTTRAEGLLEGEDVMATAAALRRMGVGITRNGDGVWEIEGVGLGGLHAPDDILNLGNSGTTARLLCGVLAGHEFTAILTGDNSLRARPMGRVLAPLNEMGTQTAARDGDRMPLSFTGSSDLLPIEYFLPVPSAQVKSAVLLAGLHAPGQTSVVEVAPTRDHTERMLAHMGAAIEVADTATGRRITVTGQPELSPLDTQVPADPSSAAFPAVAAAIVAGSEVTLLSVGVNPARIGLFDTLTEMGADLTLENPREIGGEPVADLHIRASALKGVTVPAERAASMIDEYPVLATAAACAAGTTVFEGVGELRLKESNRLAAIEDGLTACGVTVRTEGDQMVIQGCGGPPRGGGKIAANLDHRIAMSFLVLGLATTEPVTVDDVRTVDTSFPNFIAAMTRLGANITSGTKDETS
ncbi:MAG: 3-phosphoshikimate 1-carboxyvinyltransferase [Alphaproteobacteria bacterium]|nr:3-phosphoshikimate 1-carboxyvinyltransferase [Alphaproteobacteria bacterium]